MSTTRPLVVLAVVIALAGCGKAAEPEPASGAREWCESLQERGLLLEPMSRCLAEYEDATRER